MTRLRIAAVVAAAALSVVACSLLVKPSDTPAFCSEPGVECGPGLVCVRVGDGSLRCVADSCGSHDECLERNPLRPICAADGSCVECVETHHCAREGTAGPRCFEGRCVECFESAHCAVGEQGARCVSQRCEPGCDDAGCCCPEGARCVEGGFCRVPTEEICDGIDNDLDGEIDEGFDRDGDGYSTCVHVPPSGDCDDDNRDVHPGATEVCNGIDDDCNGLVDDNTCPGEVCMQMAEGVYACVARQCENDTECYDGQVCVTEAGRCEHPAGFGDPCWGTSQCRTPNPAAAGRCIRAGALGLAGEPEGRCTRICCGDVDCPAGTHCTDNGTGLKVCAPPAWFDPAAFRCGGRTGCTACLSGVCRQPCCSDEGCPGGSCQLHSSVTTPATSAGVTTLLCDVRDRGHGPYVEYGCGLFDRGFCNSGLDFVVVHDFLGSPTRCLCTMPCCRDSDCAGAGVTHPLCALDGEGRGICWPMGLSGDGWSFRVPSGAPFDAPCTDWDQCASTDCHPARYCTRVCCSDEDCGPAHDCVPQVVGAGRHASLCTRRP